MANDDRPTLTRQEIANELRALALQCSLSGLQKAAARLMQLAAAVEAM